MSPPQSIAHYTIVSKLGEGGMGAVYRATDTRLNRDVAIKVLPASFSSDPTRMARFDREAQILASLNHPNIAAIYGIEQNAIVLELVEGDDLRGPVPLATALEYARQIAAGLGAAHEKGIVHRDLKPANIKVTPDGQIKLLDFGLAKAAEPAAIPPGDSPTISPTLSLAMTQAGMILGTAAYMSPEQARGKPVDKRADIWAFGVVLYELLTGQTLFGGGETVSDSLAAVIKETPDLNRVPPQVRKLLRACLEKDPKDRLQAIGDWRLLLDEPSAAPPSAPPPPPARSYGSWAIAAVCALAALTIAAIHFRESPPVAVPVRLSLTPPEKEDFGRWLSLSPNGRLLAFSVRGRAQIWIRPLDSATARPLAGTEGANTFFWSPDSRFLAFPSEGRLRRVNVAGGPIETICSVAGGVLLGGAWSVDNQILFGATNSGIMRVPASGGTATPVTTPDMSHAESFHGYPSLLPGGRRFLYLVGSLASEWSGIYAASVDAKPAQQSRERIVATSGVSFVYLPSDKGSGSPPRLLFLRDGHLVAQPFDDRNLRPVDEAVPVADSVSTFLSLAQFSVVPGILAYHNGAAEYEVVEYRWFDRDGRELSSAGSAKNGAITALSPDDSRLAHAQSTGGEAAQVWVLDLLRHANTRLSFTPDGGTFPAWSPDGKWIAFGGGTGGVTTIYVKAADGSGSERLLLRSPEGKRVEDWSRDGAFLLFSQVAAQSGKRELWAIPHPLAEGDRTPIRVAAGAFNLGPGRISPDSRWLAYVSAESGKNEVYVRPFPPGDGRVGQWLVSSAGGGIPQWRADGKELFYLEPNPSGGNAKLMAVNVEMNPNPGRPGEGAFRAGAPHILFATPLARNAVGNRFVVSRDGKRFLLSLPQAQATQPLLDIVLNWESASRQ